MAESNIQINALPQATLPLSEDDIFHCKQGIVDKRVTLSDLLKPHTSRTDNPHGVTKSQIGLGDVANAAQLVKSQNLADLPNKATSRTNLDVYSKAETTSAVNAHASRTDNPHRVSKEQLGLGNVTNDPQLVKAQNLLDVPNKATARANLDIYSKAEAANLLNGHANRKDNPHKVTKDQVGLGNVPNYGVSQSYTEGSSSSFSSAKAVNDLYKMIQGMYPVGHRIYTDNPSNPSLYIPIGNWELAGKGRVSVGYDPANTGRPVGSVFGAASMTLQTIHLAAHQHSVVVTGGNHSHSTSTEVTSDGNHQHVAQGNTGEGGIHRHTAPVERAGDGLVGNQVIRGVAWGGGIQWNTTDAGTSDSVSHAHWFSVLTSWEGTHSHRVTVHVGASGNMTMSGTTTSSGSGQAFGIEQPSEVVYIWKRVS